VYLHGTWRAHTVDNCNHMPSTTACVRRLRVGDIESRPFAYPGRARAYPNLGCLGGWTCASLEEGMPDATRQRQGGPGCAMRFSGAADQSAPLGAGARVGYALTETVRWTCAPAPSISKPASASSVTSMSPSTRTSALGRRAKRAPVARARHPFERRPGPVVRSSIRRPLLPEGNACWAADSTSQLVSTLRPRSIGRDSAGQERYGDEQRGDDREHLHDLVHPV